MGPDVPVNRFADDAVPVDQQFTGVAFRQGIIGNVFRWKIVAVRSNGDIFYLHNKRQPTAACLQIYKNQPIVRTKARQRRSAPSPGSRQPGGPRSEDSRYPVLQDVALLTDGPPVQQA